MLWTVTVKSDVAILITVPVVADNLNDAIDATIQWVPYLTDKLSLSARSIPDARVDAVRGDFNDLNEAAYGELCDCSDGNESVSDHEFDAAMAQYEAVNDYLWRG